MASFSCLLAATILFVVYSTDDTDYGNGCNYVYEDGENYEGDNGDEYEIPSGIYSPGFCNNDGYTSWQYDCVNGGADIQVNIYDSNDCSGSAWYYQSYYNYFDDSNSHQEYRKIFECHSDDCIVGFSENINMGDNTTCTVGDAMARYGYVQGACFEDEMGYNVKYTCDSDDGYIKKQYYDDDDCEEYEGFHMVYEDDCIYDTFALTDFVCEGGREPTTTWYSTTLSTMDHCAYLLSMKDTCYEGVKWSCDGSGKYTCTVYENDDCSGAEEDCFDDSMMDSMEGNYTYIEMECEPIRNLCGAPDSDSPEQTIAETASTIIFKYSLIVAGLFALLQ